MLVLLRLSCGLLLSGALRNHYTTRASFALMLLLAACCVARKIINHQVPSYLRSQFDHSELNAHVATVNTFLAEVSSESWYPSSLFVVFFSSSSCAPRVVLVLLTSEWLCVASAMHYSIWAIWCACE